MATVAQLFGVGLRATFHSIEIARRYQPTDDMLTIDPWPKRIRVAVRRVLGDPRFRIAAHGLQVEIARHNALPKL